MQNEINDLKKVVLFMNIEMDLSFIDENSQALALYSGTEDAAGIKSKHIQTVADELSSVLKKYPHIQYGFQVVDPEQLQQQQESEPETPQNDLESKETVEAIESEPETPQHDSE